MNILIIGSGGREHALAWKTARSERVRRVFVAPGNAGTAAEPGVENVAIDCMDVDALLDFARDRAVDLTIVGPEAPLVAGIRDRFDEAGLRCFGPSARAAQLEGSKAFAKTVMLRAGVPTAAHATFSDPAAARAYLEQTGVPVVIKADGLAAGKGVVICQDHATALRTLDEMLGQRRFGRAGARVVMERFLTGEEVSFICLANEDQVLPLATSQDHKARYDGDRGPNTGGMGACSPAPRVDAALQQRILDQVIHPVLQEMQRMGAPFCGFLYAGLMIAPDGTPKVLEFNVRGGDPETQPILMRLQSDLVDLCLATLDGNLEIRSAQWSAEPCLGVVLAADGYPGDYQKGLPIRLAEENESAVKVFHAGTRIHNGQLQSTGGRVLCVCALGEDFAQAQQRAYAHCARIHFDGMVYRRDIGQRALSGK